MAVATKGKKKITFRLNGNPNEEAYLVGDFNGWDPTAKKMKFDDQTQTHTATLMLAPGRYEYKFLIGGTWCVDPNCPNWTLNELGSMNSVLIV